MSFYKNIQPIEKLLEERINNNESGVWLNWKWTVRRCSDVSICNITMSRIKVEMGLSDFGMSISLPIEILWEIYSILNEDPRNYVEFKSNGNLTIRDWSHGKLKQYSSEK